MLKIIIIGSNTFVLDTTTTKAYPMQFVSLVEKIAANVKFTFQDGTSVIWTYADVKAIIDL